MNCVFILFMKSILPSQKFGIPVAESQSKSHLGHWPWGPMAPHWEVTLISPVKKVRLFVSLTHSYFDPKRREIYCYKRLLSYLPNPSARAGYDTMSIFERSLTGLNSEFSFSSTNCLIKAEERSLSYYLPIAGGRIIGFIPFPRVLVLCEM